VENVLLPEPELMAEFVGDPYALSRLRNLMNPERPIMSGVVQNQDAYMKGKIAQRVFTNRVPQILRDAMVRYGELTGRRYGAVDAYRLDDADLAIVGLGSMVETAMATADWLRANRGLRVGVLGLTIYRPFPAAEVLEALRRVRALAVVERLDNPLAASNPLTTEVKAALADAVSGREGYPAIASLPVVYSACAGLGSRDVRPGDFVAAVEEMARGGRRDFVLGIPHEAALVRREDPDVRPPGAFSLRGHSIGGFGSVTTNRVMATLVGDLFGLSVQAYPLYGSEKKGLPTTYFLTIAGERIRFHAELSRVDFVPLNDVNAFKLGDPLAGLVPGGIVFIQSEETDPEVIWSRIPPRARATIRQRELRVLALDTARIARETTRQPDLIQRMQGIVLLGVFLRVAPFVDRQGLGEAEVFTGVERSLRRFFGKRGEAVIQENLRAVRRGYAEVIDVQVPVHA
jgi:pyruvate-ferredoxin/flavodoxin oxidoreductase